MEQQITTNKPKTIILLNARKSFIASSLRQNKNFRVYKTEENFKKCTKLIENINIQKSHYSTL